MDFQTASGSGPMSPDIFDEFESYRFSDDPEFRAGLPTVIAAIRGKDRSATQIDEMIGRAQWFYFTRLKGVTIPWEDYARRQITHPYVDPSSPRAGLVLSRTESPSTPTSRLPKLPPQGPQEALQTLNYLAEARTMMKDASTGDEDGGEGLSFAMLSKLIAEGRTEEVPVRQIPEGTNILMDQDALPSQPQMMARPKPWEMANPQPLPPPITQTQSFPPMLHQYQQNYASSSNGSPHAHLFENINPRRSSASAAVPANTYFDTPSFSGTYLPAYASYHPSPTHNGLPWASAGPTISPDLSMDTINLDPDLVPNMSGYTFNTHSSSNSHSQSGTTSMSNSSFMQQSQSQFDMSAFTSTSSLGLDESFNDFLNTDFDPEKQNATGAGVAPINLGPPVGQSSSSTPASTSSANVWTGGQTSDNTPASSHSF